VAIGDLGQRIIDGVPATTFSLLSAVYFFSKVIRFARCACFRSGEIRVVDAAGKVEGMITFNEAERKL
jgi:hypothetical protein